MANRIVLYLIIFFVGIQIFSFTMIHFLDQAQKDLVRAEKYQIEALQIRADRAIKELDSIKVENKEYHTGEASYYDYTTNNGWSSKGHLVCASRDYKRGTKLTVKNLDNGLTTTCLVTDYGPSAKIFPNRIIDLSSRAFGEIAQTKKGIINVIIYEK